MNKVFAIAVLLLMVSCTMALAAPDWVIGLHAESTDGMNGGIDPLIGAADGASDGLDAFLVAESPTDFYGDDTTKWVTTVPVGSTGTSYDSDIKSQTSYTAYPNQEKIWSLRIAALYNAPDKGGISLSFYTVSDEPYLPPAATSEWAYYMRLIDAKGQTINKPSWAGGGVWAANEKIALAVPTTTDTWFGDIILPFYRLSNGATGTTMLNDGYQFEFIQGPTAPIPEPGSLLVFGTGLAGLVGFVSRRRRV